MKNRFCGIFAAVCALAMTAGFVRPAQAQEAAKEKAPLYSYVANWVIPRAQWGEMEKGNGANQGILEKALADGTIIGYGSDVAEVHEAEGATHDSWWSAMSMAGVLNVLDKFAASGSSASPALVSATKHWDNIMVSRYYNWHTGSYKGAYTRVSAYKLKADAPEDAVEMFSKNLIVPLFEKLLAEGSVLEYEVDREAIHTDNPALFWIVFVTPNAEGLDKFDAALTAAGKANPMSFPAFGSMVDYSGHRDFLSRSAGIYK